MMWIMMMDNDIKCMSDILTVCNLLLCYYFFYHYLPWNNDFRSGPKAQIWQIQPPLLPVRLREGRYLTLIMGAIDRGEWGDQDALGLRFIRWMEGKICTISCFWYATRGVHCMQDHVVDAFVVLCIQPWPHCLQLDMFHRYTSSQPS